MHRGENDVTISQALNINATVPEDPSLPILIGRDIDGNAYILGVRQADAAIALSGKAPPIIQIAGGGPVDARQMEPGLVYTTGGLIARVRSCFYRWDGTDRYYNGGQLNMGDYLPASSGLQHWVKVGLNPATNALVAVEGTDYPTAVPLTPSMANSISFNNYLPLAAIKLRYGQTSLSESDFLDIRLWISGSGGAGGGSGLWQDGTSLEVVDNAITPTGSFHLVYSTTITDIEEINGGESGRMLVLAPNTSGQPITLKHSYPLGGNIYTMNGYDIDLSENGQAVLLLYREGLDAWVMVSGATQLSDLGDVGMAPTSPNYVLAAGDGTGSGAYRGRRLVPADLPDPLLDVATDDVSNPPSLAELNAIFGSPASAGAGTVRLLDDNGAGSAMYLLACDGSNWWYASMTKAT